jgi:hypothetical protein
MVKKKKPAHCILGHDFVKEKCEKVECKFKELCEKIAKGQ